jgi:hypothetical protein
VVFSTFGQLCESRKAQRRRYVAASIEHSTFGKGAERCSEKRENQVICLSPFLLSETHRASAVGPHMQKRRKHTTAGIRCCAGVQAYTPTSCTTPVRCTLVLSTQIYSTRNSLQIQLSPIDSRPILVEIQAGGNADWEDRFSFVVGTGNTF